MQAFIGTTTLNWHIHFDSKPFLSFTSERKEYQKKPSLPNP